MYYCSNTPLNLELVNFNQKYLLRPWQLRHMSPFTTEFLLIHVIEVRRKTSWEKPPLKNGYDRDQNVFSMSSSSLEWAEIKTSWWWTWWRCCGCQDHASMHQSVVNKDHVERKFDVHNLMMEGNHKNLFFYKNTLI